ncbi:MAG: HAD hydrolase-like protein [Lachnospiraceae bacterium]|nr:HAD hydrolase-like protein [Lachnospiraceae bacterium]
MKYKCLVFDHDDTTVNSTAKIHFPSFVEFLKIYRPGASYTLDDYVKYNFDPGILPFFTQMCGFSEEELVKEQEFWADYASRHVADAFAGIKEIMDRQKAQGGYIAVVSHSLADNILRDYAHNCLPKPDMIFGWEQPKEERKPSPYPLFKLMETYNLKPEEMLVIDDLKPGLIMSRAAGVPFAGAGWCFDIPENEKYMRENADFYFKTVKELADHCK